MADEPNCSVVFDSAKKSFFGGWASGVNSLVRIVSAVNLRGVAATPSKGCVVLDAMRRVIFKKNPRGRLSGGSLIEAVVAVRGEHRRGQEAKGRGKSLRTPVRPRESNCRGRSAV